MTTSQAATGKPTDRHELDYAIEDNVLADTPQAMKALADPTRIEILGLLLDRAATTSQLAETLDKPKGTIGYHLNVLADTGLVRVVRTRKVRALTEKYYGRVGRTIVYSGLPDEADPFFMLHQAIREAVIVEGDPLPMFTIRRARIPVERAVEFAERVADLAEEFISLRHSGDRVFGFVAGIYPTELPTLKDDEATT